jgi:pimeloyl-ACP methyl ester carboxylesterase
MWYTASPNDISNWTIREATSSDGINWFKNGVNLNPSQNWDNEGVVWPYILKINDEYKMWYGARNNDGYWRIGYATSIDGTSWQLYPNNPIIDYSSSGKSVNCPSVYYNGINYEIVFESSDGISYSTSSDGIDWGNPNNIVTKTPGSFDSNFLTASKLFIYPNNTYAVYYSGLGYINNILAYRIGLATDGPMPNPFNTPIPTPTQIQSPTPSPSPSPTPTQAPSSTPSPSVTPSPTPISISPTPTNTPEPSPTPSPKPHSRKVILIPGMFGSWNADAIVNCKPDNYEGNWQLFPMLGSTVYNPAIETLRKAGYNVTVFPYDWRKPVMQNAQLLANKIQELTSDDSTVHLVGHSMGGLVARAYAEQNDQSHNLESLLTVGSPHKGVPVAYPEWSAGIIWSDELFMRITLNLAIKRCASVHRISAQDVIRTHIPSIQQLLPIYDYLMNNKTHTWVPIETMNAHNNWLTDNTFIPPFSGISVGSIVGNGFKTLRSITVKNPPDLDVKKGLWLDGKPVSKHYSDAGDGTVLVKSAQLQAADSVEIEDDHIGIMQSNTGAQEILSFIQNGSFRSESSMVQKSSETRPTSALVIIGYPSAFIVTDEKGTLRKDDSGIVTILNPKTFKYKLKLQPFSQTTTLIIAQFHENGDIIIRDYSLPNLLPKFKSIKFNTSIPENNPLE